MRLSRLPIGCAGSWQRRGCGAAVEAVATPHPHSRCALATKPWFTSLSVETPLGVCVWTLRFIGDCTMLQIACNMTRWRSAVRCSWVDRLLHPRHLAVNSASVREWLVTVTVAGNARRSCWKSLRAARRTSKTSRPRWRRAMPPCCGSCKPSARADDAGRWTRWMRAQRLQTAVPSRWGIMLAFGPQPEPQPRS